MSRGGVLEVVLLGGQKIYLGGMVGKDNDGL